MIKFVESKLLKMKIVYLDAFTVNHGDLSWSVLESLGELNVYDHTNPDEIIERAKNAEIIIVNKMKLDRFHFDQLPILKYVVVSATGYNNINIEDAKHSNVLVSNVSGYSTNSVVQFIFSSLLSLSNRIEYYQDEVSKGRWSTTRDFCFYDHSIDELRGKTLGIYGYGNIGSAVAKMAHCFGMKILVVNKYPETTDLKIASNVTSDELFEQSDIISFHVPLTDDTNGLIGTDNLNLMKSNAVIINTARGGLVNEEELSNHLSQNERFVAILDVLSVEPPPEDNLLIGLHNCKITPHLAWASKQSRGRLIEGVARNVKAYQDLVPMNLVGK